MSSTIPNWLFQLIITIFVLGVSGYMLVTNQQVPDLLLGMLISIVSFYFGTVNTQNLYKEPPK